MAHNSTVPLTRFGMPTRSVRRISGFVQTPKGLRTDFWKSINTRRLLGRNVVSRSKKPVRRSFFKTTSSSARPLAAC